MRRSRSATAGAATLALVLFIPAAAEAEPINGTGTDVVLLMGSSGGPLFPTDLTRQKNAVVTALLDEAYFPLDESMAVGVVQWAHDDENDLTRLEIPLTILDSEATRDSIIAAIQAIDDIINPMSNPGDAVRAGTDLLKGTARVSADWVLCMTADGVGNAGEPLGTAAAHAQASLVDRYGVVAFEAPQFATELHADYAPHVFGDGSVAVVPPDFDASEAAPLLLDACLDEVIELVALEVNQAVQNWENTVQLIAERYTVVRVFAQVPSGAERREVTGLLFGSRDGVDLPGSPLTAVNPGGLLLDTDVTDRRAVLADSFNFVLPEAWRSGTVTLWFEAEDAEQEEVKLACWDAAQPTPRDCSTTVQFKEMPTPTIRFMAVPYEQAGSTVEPTAAHLWEQGFRVESQLPVPRVDLQTGWLQTGFGAKPDLIPVNNRLQVQRALEGCDSAQGCHTLYYGVLLGNGGGRAAGIPGYVAASFNNGNDNRTDAGWFRNVAGHELGHSFGLWHAVANPPAAGHCGGPAPAVAPPHPHIGQITGSAGTKTAAELMGPLGDPDTEVWGLDRRFVHADLNRLAVISPHETAALMSYCWVGSPQDLWPSDHEWDLLISGLEAQVGAQSEPLTTTGAHLLISGSIAIEEDPETATLDPVLLVEGDFTVPEPGGYRVVLRDDGDVIVREVAFEPVELHARPGDLDEDEPPDVGLFTVPVPAPDGAYRSVQVLDGGGEVLGEVSASGNPPVVSITSPGAGSVLDSEHVTFTWEASDPDGDTLTFTLRYSPDLGQSWKTLGIGLAADTLTVPRSELPASTNPGAIFEVIASDGVLAASATSDPFTVTDNDPLVLIVSPGDGEELSGDQVLLLEAVAHDPEDGRLHGDDIAWSSDGDGELGTGGELVLLAGDLSLGVHDITAMATDSAGNTGAASVTVTIAEADPPPDDPPPGSPPPDGLDRPPPAEASTGDRATAQDPLVVRLWSPMGGPVAIDVLATVSAAPPGWVFADRKAHITAPDAAADNPIVIEFRLHLSQLAPGQAPADVALYRDGARVADCTEPDAGAAWPDPCVQSRTATGDEVTVMVLSSQASVWHLARPDLTVSPPDLLCPGDAERPRFTDVDQEGVHAAAIGCAALHGIARGLPDGTYVPQAPLRRDQMASFVARALQAAGRTLPASAHDFVDLDGNPHAEAIGQLAAAGIVRGTSAATYSPDLPARRDQLASVLARALGPVVDDERPATASRYFIDTAGNPHETAIDIVFEHGLTVGRSPGHYGPAEDVRRDQAATFAIRLLATLVGAH